MSRLPIFDYGDYHVFRITVLDVRPAAGPQSTPKLLSYMGTNIIQYPGTLRKADARAFEKRIPSVKRPEPSSRYITSGAFDSSEALIKTFSMNGEPPMTRSSGRRL